MSPRREGEKHAVPGVLLANLDLGPVLEAVRRDGVAVDAKEARSEFGSLTTKTTSPPVSCRLKTRSRPRGGELGPVAERGRAHRAVELLGLARVVA